MNRDNPGLKDRAPLGQIAFLKILKSFHGFRPPAVDYTRGYNPQCLRD